MRSLIGILRAIGFTVWSLALTPAQMLILLSGTERYNYKIPCLWHKGICLLFSLRTNVSGLPATGRHIIYVANHLSYLDIPVVGSIVPASFVAKKEVSGWPVFGFLAKLQQTVFIDRKPGSARAGTDAIKNVIKAGKSIIVFPEGTSSNGETVLDFKSSIFSPLFEEGKRNKDYRIQPLTIILENIENSGERDLYAWYGDMEMIPHLWNYAKNKGSSIKLIFHRPIEIQKFQDRKALSNFCRESVVCGLEKKEVMNGELDTEKHIYTLAS
jgi:1-acyl-sn-glycerol-3-phosphate acyltransferase